MAALAAGAASLVIGLLFGLLHGLTLHALVHLGLGLAGVMVARTFAGAQTYLVVAGIGALVLAVCELGASPAVGHLHGWLDLVMAAAVITAAAVFGRTGPRLQTPGR